MRALVKYRLYRAISIAAMAAVAQAAAAKPKKTKKSDSITKADANPVAVLIFDPTLPLLPPQVRSAAKPAPTSFANIPLLILQRSSAAGDLTVMPVDAAKKPETTPFTLVDAEPEDLSVTEIAATLDADAPAK